MVCGTCGFENQVGNRFCGMCGTPLPHRPLTTPGAQSTAVLTRPLVENSRPAGTPNASTAASPEVDDRSHLTEQSEVLENPSDGRAISQDRTSQRLKPTPTQFDLVPEIPLAEYVQKFRYIPPTNPEEVTMRCDAPVQEPEASTSSDTSLIAPTETAVASAETPPPASTDDVRERLGLEVDSTSEERKDRPRFLDFNEPAGSPNPEPAPAAISGPSFLGLSDAPEPAGATGDEVDARQPARGRWRIGLVAAVLLVVGVLGVLEWRAQVHQTNNGPIEIVKMKMRDLARNKPAETTTPAASSSVNADSTAKPEMQVDPASTAQNQAPNPSATTASNATNGPTGPNASTGTGTPANSANSVPSSGSTPAGQVAAGPPQNSAVKPAQAPVAPNPNTEKPSARSDNASQSARSSPAPSGDKGTSASQPANPSGEVVAKKAAPGADEIAKANNASDSAAEAAWLWKATAKGNPDAPVRLADMYAKGDGVPRSCEQALVLLKTAATKQNAVARNRLASMYGSGTCVPRDRVEAYRWLSSALDANPNSDWARQNRDLLWRQMTPEERGSIQPPH